MLVLLIRKQCQALYLAVAYVKQHTSLSVKTKTISKTINPVWNETFTLFVDDRCALANINVSKMSQAEKKDQPL